MRCNVCGKTRQLFTRCAECKKVKKRQSNLRYRAKKKMSKTLRKLWNK